MNINAVLDGNPVKIVDINRVGSSAYVAFINAGGQLVSNVYHTSAFDVANISLSTSAINIPDDYSVSAVSPLSSTTGLNPTISLQGLTGDASNWIISANVNIFGSTSASNLYTSGSVSSSSFLIRTPSTGIEFGDSNTKIATGSGNLYFNNNNKTGLRIDSNGDVIAHVSLATPILNVTSNLSVTSTGIGFYGASPVAKQVVTNTVIPNPVLATENFMTTMQQLLNALKTYGLV